MPAIVFDEGKAMNGRAVNEQRQQAQWRVFMMFVALALLIIRTGLVSRGVMAVLPAASIAHDAAPAAKGQPSSTDPAALYQATLVLLCFAEAAGQLLIQWERTLWELMNQPLPGPAPERSLHVTSLCSRQVQFLDTS